MAHYRASWLSGCVLSLGLTACATAPASTTMAFDGTVLAPYQHIELCADHPTACPDSGDTALDGDRPSNIRAQYWRAAFGSQPPTPPAGLRLEITEATWGLLTRVNREVNAAVRYQSDLVTYGRPDVWALPIAQGGALVGDCKDMALEKRRRLVAAGLPADSLALTLVETRDRRPHAVLTVITDHGDYVLDSQTPWPSAWRDLAYTWLERQAPGTPAIWVRLARAG